jgi:TonB family protein
MLIAIFALLAASTTPTDLEATRTAKPEAVVMVRNPDWLRKPTEPEVAGWFPLRARADRVSGRATIDCAVTRGGGLSDCRVASESPAGYGFGDAALMMAPSFAMEAPAAKGTPVGHVRVQTSIEFQTAPVVKLSAPRGGLIDNPPWSAAPTVAQVAAAFPTNESYGFPYGHVVLMCRELSDGSVTDCGIASETPAGYGFARAALRLVGDFRVADAQPNRNSSAEIYVSIPFDFRDPTAPQPPAVVVDPQWLVMPNPATAGKLFPSDAARAGYKSGVATVDCQVAHSGQLINCAASNESPAGFGFGTIALAIAHVMIMNPWTRQGAPVDGARISMPIRVNLGG